MSVARELLGDGARTLTPRLACRAVGPPSPDRPLGEGAVLRAAIAAVMQAKESGLDKR